MSLKGWNELKSDIGGVYVFIKWAVLIGLMIAVVWSLKSCTWEKFWESGFY